MDINESGFPISFMDINECDRAKRFHGYKWNRLPNGRFMDINEVIGQAVSGL